MLYQLTFDIKETNKLNLTKTFDNLVHECRFEVIEKSVIISSPDDYRRYYITSTGILMLVLRNKEDRSFVSLITSSKSVMTSFKCSAITAFELINPVIREL